MTVIDEILDRLEDVENAVFEDGEDEEQEEDE